MIEIRRVAARAGAFQLTDISFDIPANAYGVIVGAAGCGKTTLLEVIAGVHPLSEGQVMLNARDATQMPPEQRAIGLVYQRGALFPHRSVEENIGWSGTNGDATQDIVERLAIAPLFKTPVSRLSGGERQLVALARALVRVRACLNRGEAPALLLDEPFSALDPRRRLATRETVHYFHTEWKLTTLQVTHDGTDARRADVAVLMDAGRIVQSGAPAEMLRAPVRDDVGLFLQGAV